MAEVVNIHFAADANLSPFIAQVRAATAAVDKFNASTVAGKSAIGQNAYREFNDAIAKTGQFHQQMVSVRSEAERFAQTMSAKKLGWSESRAAIREYRKEMKVAYGEQRGIISQMAKEQLRLQQSMVVSAGRDSAGRLAANVITPNAADITKAGAAAKYSSNQFRMLHEVIRQSNESLINMGKNTQWAGRQMMVGLSIPIGILAGAATAAFIQMDKDLVRIQKVYGSGLNFGDDFKKQAAVVREESMSLARELAANLGQSSKETLGLTADIAATGKEGKDLADSVRQASRLAVLGEVDRQEAMKATLVLQTAFKQNTDQLSQSIDFMNAVENQTSLTLQDMTEAIPRAGATIKNLGGGIKELSLFMTAMKEGGVSAGEGANALKSGLASIIAPTQDAQKNLLALGIDIKGIANKNAGNLVGTVLELAKAMEKLDPNQKTEAMVRMFGKFQYNKMAAMFNNIGKEGSQTLKVMELMGMSTADLAKISDQEIKTFTESASGRFKRAMESMKTQLAILGKDFAGIFAGAMSVVGKVLDVFNNLPGPVKMIVELGLGIAALIGPAVMIGGVMMNFVGTLSKFVNLMRTGFKRGIFTALTPELVAADQLTDQLIIGFGKMEDQIMGVTGAVHSLTQALSGASKVAGGGNFGGGILNAPFLTGSNSKGKANRSTGLILGSSPRNQARHNIDWTPDDIQKLDPKALAGISTVAKLAELSRNDPALAKTLEQLRTETSRSNQTVSSKDLAAQLLGQHNIGNIYSDALTKFTNASAAELRTLVEKLYMQATMESSMARLGPDSIKPIQGANLAAQYFAGSLAGTGQQTSIVDWLSGNLSDRVGVGQSGRNHGLTSSDLEHFVSSDRLIAEYGKPVIDGIKSPIQALTDIFTKLGISTTNINELMRIYQPELDRAIVAAAQNTAATNQATARTIGENQKRVQNAQKEKAEAQKAKASAVSAYNNAKQQILDQASKVDSAKFRVASDAIQKLRVGGINVRGLDAGTLAEHAGGKKTLTDALYNELKKQGQSVTKTAIGDLLPKNIANEAQTAQRGLDKLTRSLSTLRDAAIAAGVAFSDAKKNAKSADQRIKNIDDARKLAVEENRRRNNEALAAKNAAANAGGVGGAGNIQLKGGLWNAINGIDKLIVKLKELGLSAVRAAGKMGGLIKNNIGKIGGVAMGAGMLSSMLGTAEGTGTKATAINSLNMASMGAGAGMMTGNPYAMAAGAIGGAVFGYIQKLGEKSKEAGNKIGQLAENISKANAKLSDDLVKKLGGTPLSTALGSGPVDKAKAVENFKYDTGMEKIVKEQADDKIKALEALTVQQAIVAAQNIYSQLVNTGVSNNVAKSFVDHLMLAANKVGGIMELNVRLSDKSIADSLNTIDGQMKRITTAYEDPMKQWGDQSSSWSAIVPWNNNDYLSDGQLSENTKKVIMGQANEFADFIATTLSAASERAKKQNKKFDILEEFNKLGPLALSKQIDASGRGVTNRIVSPKGGMKALFPGRLEQFARDNFQTQETSAGSVAITESQASVDKKYLGMGAWQRDQFQQMGPQFQEYAKTIEASSDTIAQKMLQAFSPEKQALIGGISQKLQEGRNGLTQYQSTLIGIAATEDGAVKTALQNINNELSRGGNLTNVWDNAMSAAGSNAQSVLAPALEKARRDIADFNNQQAKAGKPLILDVNAAAIAMATSDAEALGLTLDDLAGTRDISLVVHKRIETKEFLQKAAGGEKYFGTQAEVDQKNQQGAATSAATGAQDAANAAQEADQKALDAQQKGLEAAQKQREKDIENVKKYYDDQIEAINKAEEARKKAYDEEQKRQERNKSLRELQLAYVKAVASGDTFGALSAKMSIKGAQQKWQSEDANTAAENKAKSKVDALTAERDAKTKAMQEQADAQKAIDDATMEAARAASQERIKGLQDTAKAAQDAAAATNNATNDVMFTTQQFGKMYADAMKANGNNHAQAMAQMAADTGLALPELEKAWADWSAKQMGIPVDVANAWASGAKQTAKVMQLFSQIINALANGQDPTQFIAELSAVENMQAVGSTVGSSFGAGNAAGSAVGNALPKNNPFGATIPPTDTSNWGKPAAPLKASGGAIYGPGSGTSDSIPAWLSNGEYVVKAKSVGKYGKPLLDAINAGRYADGGSVGAAFGQQVGAQSAGTQIGNKTSPFGGMLDKLVTTLTGQVERLLITNVEQLGNARVQQDQRSMASDNALAAQKATNFNTEISLRAQIFQLIVGHETLIRLMSQQTAAIVNANMHTILVSTLNITNQMTAAFRTWRDNSINDVRAVAAEIVNSFTRLDLKKIQDMINSFATGDGGGGTSAQQQLGGTTAVGATVKVATGGYISGPGTGTSDSIPARLSNGEYVIKNSSVKRYGTGFLDKVNQGQYAVGGPIGFADGGVVGGIATTVSDKINEGFSKGIQKAIDAKAAVLSAVSGSSRPVTGEPLRGTAVMEQFASLVESYLGKAVDVFGMSVDGMCLRNMNNFWESMGGAVQRHSTALEQARAVESAGLMHKNDNAPRGALVWFDERVGTYAGHVAVADGYGNFINEIGSPNGSVIGRQAMGSWGGYIGWSEPDAQRYAAGGIVSNQLRELIAAKKIGANPAGWKLEARQPAPSSYAASNVNVSVEGGDFAKAIYSFLKSQGLSIAGIAGILGNFDRESGLNPAITESGLPVDATIGGTKIGLGLAQWTGPRHDALLNFAQQRGKPWTDLSLQLEMMMTEIAQNGWQGMWEQLKTVTDPREASAIFAHTFEGAQYGIYADRDDRAAAWYEKIKNGFATGGHVRGPGSATSDSIPARLSNGEYVVNARSVKKYGTKFMDQINAGRYADGGVVTAPLPKRKGNDSIGPQYTNWGLFSTVAMTAADLLNFKRDLGPKPKTAAKATDAKKDGTAAGKAEVKDGLLYGVKPETIITRAKQALGTPYSRDNRQGGPGSGFDCSSFTYWAYDGYPGLMKNAWPTPGWTGTLINEGKPRDMAAIKPGDILLHNPESSASGHAALYIGNGQIQHSADPNQISPVDIWGGFEQARQILAYAKGGLVIPALRKGATINYDNTLANLHRGETVLTSGLTKKLNDGIDNIASGGDVSYNVNVNINKANATPAEIEQAVYSALSKKETKAGRSRVIGGRR